VLEMLGISVNPMRLKCAILPLKIIEEAIHNYNIAMR